MRLACSLNYYCIMVLITDNAPMGSSIKWYVQDNEGRMCTDYIFYSQHCIVSYIYMCMLQ